MARDPAQLLGAPTSGCTLLPGRHLGAALGIGRAWSPSSVLWSSSLDLSQDVVPAFP